MARVVPNAGAHIGISFVQATQHAECQRNSVVGHHFGTITRHYAYRSTVLRCRRHIDIVVSDARSAYNAQIRKRLKHLGRELTIGSNHTIGIGSIADDSFGLTLVEQGNVNTCVLRHTHFKVVVFEVGVNNNDFRHCYPFLPPLGNGP